MEIQKVISLPKITVYRCGDDVEESDAQHLPEVPHVADTVPRSDKLSQSLIMLKESLSSGKIITQFEVCKF